MTYANGYNYKYNGKWKKGKRNDYGKMTYAEWC
jgi:hypothetical protein